MAPTIMGIENNLNMNTASERLMKTGLDIGNQVIRGYKKKKPAPVFINARYKNFFILFQWAKVTEETFYYALLIIFIFSVIATIVCKILQEFEREILTTTTTTTTTTETGSTTTTRRRSISPWLRLGAGLAFTLRLAIIYVIITMLMTQNIWVLLVLLLGNFMGWVIYSAIGNGNAQSTQIDAAIALAEQKRINKEKQIDENDSVSAADHSDNESV